MTTFSRKTTFWAAALAALLMLIGFAAPAGAREIRAFDTKTRCDQWHVDV